MDILKLLDELHELAVNSPRTTLGLTRGLDRDKINMTISKIRASLPDEVKAAQQTVRESDRIVGTARDEAAHTLESAKRESERMITEAKAESEKILEHARAAQDRMVHESEILKLAKAQSEEVRAVADRDSMQMRKGAETYALDVLNQLEGVVGRVMSAIERGKTEVQPRDERPAIPAGRDRR